MKKNRFAAQIALVFAVLIVPMAAHGLGLGLGLGLGNQGVKKARVAEFSLASSLPTGFTVTRSGSNATARNASGVWSVVAANTARFHMLDGDTETGLLVEPSRTNKCTNYNWNMTNFTNATVGGNGSATVTIGTHPVHGHPVYRINNTTGGSGAAWITFGGTFANLNPHSMRVQFRVLSGASAGGGAYMNDSAGAMTSVTGAGTALNTDGTLKLENFTPTNTGRSMRVYAAFNHDVIFWLNQVEESAFSTTPIVVAGASATRNVDRVQATDLAATFGSAWNQSRGTIGLQVRVPILWESNQFFSQFSNNSTNNVIGLQLRYGAGSETGYVRPQVVAGGVTQSAVSVAKILVNRDFPMALAWGSGGYKTVAGAGRTVRETGATLPTTTLTRFDLTSRHTGTSNFYGVIKKLVVANQILPNAKLGELLMDDGAKGIVTAGQSLVDNHRRSQTTLDNAGEVSFIGVLDSVWTGTVGNNWMVHGALGGAAVLHKYDGGVGSYYDDVTAEFKSTYMLWKDSVDFFKGGGGEIEAILWDGGQQDASADAFDTLEKTQEEYEGHIAIWTQMRSVVGDVPVIISPTTGRTDTEDTMYQNLRELQWRLADDLAYVYRGAESFDLEKIDAIHLTSAGYQTKAQRESRKALKVLGETITGGVDGASIVSAVRSGTTVTVTLSHDAGTDITPSSGIRGFRFFDDATPITISSAVRTNATTITLTLASVPTGEAETLYYGYASLYAEAGDYANLVKDNGTPVMPLRAYKQSLPVLPNISTYSVPIAATGDDTTEHIGVGMVNDAGGGSTQLFGDTTDALTYKVNAGFRFDGVALAQGADIQEAYVTIAQDRHPTVDGAPAGFWQAVDADDAAAFAGADRPSVATGTTATTAWQTHDWGIGKLATRHDVTPILQEVVDRGGWASGNAVNFYALASTTDGNAADTWDDYSTTSPTVATLNVSSVLFRGVSDQPLDVNITTAQDNEDFERLIDKAVELGAPMVRIDVQVRHIVFDSSGTDIYFWDDNGIVDYDAVFDYAETAGVQVLPILAYWPTHYLPADATTPESIRYAPDVASSTKMTKLAAFVEAFDAHYADAPLAGIQIANEVNSDSFFTVTASLSGAGWNKAKVYAEMMDVVTDGQTFNHPIVHAGLTAPDWEFLLDMVEHNPDHLTTFDVFAYHGYHFSQAGGLLAFDDPAITQDEDGWYEGGTEGYYNYPEYGHNIRKVFEDADIEMPIWITEYGYIMDGNIPFGVTQAVAAQKMVEGVRFYSEEIGAERIFIYGLEPAGDGFEIYDSYKKIPARLMEAYKNIRTNPPQDMVLTAIDGGFEVGFNEPVSTGVSILSYTVQYKKTADVSYTDQTINPVDGDLPEFATVTGLDPEEYTVRVYATSVYGDSRPTATDTVTPLGAQTVQSAIPLVGGKGLVAYWSAKQHDGTTTWANVIDTPADGSAQSAYNITQTGTAPTWDGQKFVMNNSGRWAGVNTAFTNSLHQTTSGNEWTWFAYVKTNNTNAQLDSVFGTADSDTDTGVSIRVDSGGSLKLDQRTGTRVTEENTPNTTTNTLYKMVVRRDQNAGQTSFALNEDTFEVTTHTYNANTSNATYNFNVGAEGNGGNPMDASTELYAVGLINRAITNDELAALNDAIEAEFTPPDPLAPGQVDSVQATPADSKIHMAWRLTDTGGVGESGITYQPQYKLTSSGTWLDFGSPISNTYVDVTGLTNGSQYDVRVYAINSVGNGTPSAAKTALIPVVAGTAPYDFQYYKVTLPVNSSGLRTGSALEILQPAFNTYTGAWVGRGDGYIDFYVPDGGATTATATYCRTELRHLTNFPFDESTEDTVQFSVHDMLDNEKMVVHQIHGLDNPWVKASYTHKDNGTGRLRYLVKPNYGDADITITGLTNIEEGDVITSRIVYTYLGSNTGRLDFYVNGSFVGTSELNRSAVDGDGGAAYWKRGAYYQSMARTGNIARVRHYTQSGQYVP